MIGETEIHGVFLPALLVLGIGAFLITLVLRVILQRTQFYRFVWHAGLFDTALYVVILWVAVLVTLPANSSGVGP
jgi:protein AaeX